MAGSLNQVTLIGNVCKAPEIRRTQDGKAIANFTLATNESWRDKQSGERKEKAEFHRISIFGNLAEITEKYVKKGSKILIIGALQTRKWTDKNGNDKYTTEIVLSGFNGKLTMLDSKGDSDNSGDAYVQQPKQQNQATQGFIDSQLDDEIPFVLIGLGLSLVPFLSMGGIV